MISNSASAEEIRCFQYSIMVFSNVLSHLIGACKYW